MDIGIKVNLHLWLLTGRVDGFTNAPLNSGITYRGPAAPEEVRAARALLKLDDTRHDFYVIGAMAAALASAPLLRELPDDRSLVFVEDLTSLQPLSIASATLTNRADGYGYIDGRAAGKNGFTTITITRVGSTALIQRDDGYRGLAPFTHAGDILTIPSLADHGVMGRLQLPDWVEGKVITIHVAATRYPYADMAKAIPDSPLLTRLMLEEGVMDAFVSSIAPIHKVGALVAAIMLRMAKTIGSSVLDFAPEYEGLFTGGSSARRLMVDGAELMLDGVFLTYDNRI